MSDFYCEKCNAIIADTEYGYVRGCEHYPVEDLDAVCKHCKHNNNGHCTQGNDNMRYKLSNAYYFGCEDYIEI